MMDFDASDDEEVLACLALPCCVVYVPCLVLSYLVVLLSYLVVTLCCRGLCPRVFTSYLVFCCLVFVLSFVLWTLSWFVVLSLVFFCSGFEVYIGKGGVER